MTAVADYRANQAYSAAIFPNSFHNFSTCALEPALSIRVFNSSLSLATRMLRPYGQVCRKAAVTISANVPNLRITKLGEKWPAFSCLERLEAGQTF